MAEGLPSGAPDPRDAIYWANNAKLEFSRNKAKSEATAENEKSEAGYKYNQGQLRKAEPIRLKANQNSANNQGLLESGQLAQTQGRAQSEYAGKESRLNEGRREAANAYTNKLGSADSEYGVNTGINLAEATECQRQQLLENPPQASTLTTGAAQAAGAPGVAAVKAQAAKPAVPRIASVKAQPTTGGARAGAIAKVKKRAGL